MDIFPPSKGKYEFGVFGEVYYHEYFPDGRVAAVTALTFGQAQICLGRDDDKFGYENFWVYSTIDKAIQALKDWDGSGGEPEGWHRHTATGRRRTDGDPSTEYIAH